MEKRAVSTCVSAGVKPAPILTNAAVMRWLNATVTAKTRLVKQLFHDYQRLILSVLELILIRVRLDKSSIFL